MEKLHREPTAYTRDYKAFISELKQFHQNRGTQFRHVPRINGREVDLFSLYNQVTAQGGWVKVNDNQKWDSVLESLQLSKSCANGALALRQLYIRYLSLYEKIHYLGEDPDDDADQTSADTRARKQQNTMVHSVPMAYNHAQHELTDTQRSALGMAQVFCYPTEYDKLCLSLLSGLPNEQDFALNICTLLSNEGRHTLHLERNPRLLDLLIAQTGIWPTGDPSLRSFYLQCWKDVEGRRMEKFWENTLDTTDQDILELWRVNKGSICEQISREEEEEDEEDEIFNLSQNPGIRNAEGQRILRIALILYNLSFESHNVPVLAVNSSCLRFLQLCIYCRWSSLRQIALDTFGNLAGQVTLSFKENLTSRLLLRTVTEGIDSTDRFIVIRSLEILAHLAQCDQNDDVLSCCVDFKVFQRIMTLLTIHDIMLLVYSLEALYSLSELGRCVCEKIVRVHKAIATLVSLLTLDPQISGPGEGNFKLVETFEPVMVTTASTPQPTPSPSKASIPGQEVDSESFASAWLKATYELAHSCSVPRNDLYADYVSYCSKVGKKCVVNANVFSNTVRTVFPHSGLKKVESATGNIIFHHDSLKRRTIPAPISLTQRGASPYASQGPTPLASGLGPPPRTPSPLPAAIGPSYSPILKAQLSAPLRSQTPPLPGHSNLHQVLVGQSAATPSPPPSPHYPSPTPSPTPPQSCNTNLIKSLLASKVSRNLQRQQLIQQGSRLETSNGYPASQTTPVKNTPRVQHQTAKATVRAKVTSPPPNKIIKDVVVPMPAKNVKVQKCKTLPVLVTASRINGIQRDLQLEVCSQAEEATSLSARCQETRIERIQNSVQPMEESSNESIPSCVTGERDILAAAMSVLGPNFVQSTQNGLSDLSNDSTSMANNAPIVPQQRVIESRPATIATTFIASPSSPSTGVIKATSPNQILKTVLINYQPETEEELKRRRMDKDKVYKNSPLLNGLLDRGIVTNDMVYFPQKNHKNGNDGTQESCEADAVTEFVLQPNSQIILQESSERTSEENCRPVGFPLKKEPSDLSSISDITRTLETASKAISRTNAECHSQIPFVTVPATTAGATHIVSVVRINPQSIGVPVISGGSQQILQTHFLRLQAPTVTLKMDNSMELTGFPRLTTAQLHQVQQQVQLQAAEQSISTATLKRPSSSAGTTCIVLEAKRPRPETKTPLLEASLRTAAAADAIQVKQTFQDTRTILPKIQPKPESKPNSQPLVAKTGGMGANAATVVLAVTTNANATCSTATTSTITVPEKDSGAAKLCNGKRAEGQSSKLKYMCEWKNCLKVFPTPVAVFVHASKTHCPLKDTGEATCEWENCDRMKRKRFSLLTHLQDRHCNDQMLHMQAMRRQQMAQFGKSTIPPPQPPPPHPGYAPDAAVLAIRRHALQYLQARELVDEKEGPLTKSIRLTAALVLRNLVIYCPSAISHLRQHEPELANLAMSNVESSRTIAQCLSELARPRE